MKRLLIGAVAIAAMLSTAPSALAQSDRGGGVETDPGNVRNSTQADRTVYSEASHPWNVMGDPSVTVSANGTVRPADMAAAHRPSAMAVPPDSDMAAIHQSWNALCGKAETSGRRPGGSEHCRDTGH